MPSSPDADIARVRASFAEFEDEWERLRKDTAGRVSFEIQPLSSTNTSHLEHEFWRSARVPGSSRSTWRAAVRG